MSTMHCEFKHFLEAARILSITFSTAAASILCKYSELSMRPARRSISSPSSYPSDTSERTQPHELIAKMIQALLCRSSCLTGLILNVCSTYP